jgi:hypothetical protein
MDVANEATASTQMDNKVFMEQVFLRVNLKDNSSNRQL